MSTPTPGESAVPAEELTVVVEADVESTATASDGTDTGAGSDSGGTIHPDHVRTQP